MCILTWSSSQIWSLHFDDMLSRIALRVYDIKSLERLSSESWNELHGYGGSYVKLLRYYHVINVYILSTNIYWFMAAW